MKQETKIEKKQWTKPELIALVRSNPEEAVLITCKVSSAPAGPVTGFAVCDIALCATCQFAGSS